MKQVKLTYDDLMKAKNVSNPNLLINGDFRINQRGESSYQSNGSGTNQRIYSVDRLNVYNGALVEYADSIVTVTLSNQYAGVRYRFEESEYKYLAGKTVTFSIKISNATLGRQVVMQLYYSDSGSEALVINDDGITSLTVTLPEDLEALDCRIISYVSGEGESIFNLDYMKLEIGETATPFSPRPYAEELALCQRYYQVIKAENRSATSSYAEFGFGYFSSTTTAIIEIPILITLRTTPTLTISDVGDFKLRESYSSYVNPTDISLYTHNISSIMLSVTGSYSSNYGICSLRPNNTEGAYIEFDAEIY